MRKLFFILLLLTVYSLSSHSQGIRGRILDLNGEPVPYAAIFIKELTRGTTCNALGQFSLPLQPGNYTIFFRSLGYTEVTRDVDVGESFTELEIELPPQTYMIPEVRISASGEDPAYWIMRKAIGLANYHMNEVASYQAEIYIKGTALLDEIPRAIARRIEVGDMKVRKGEVYMLESLNNVRFNAPDTYEMTVIASQNTLPGYTDNVNPMDYVNASLYQQQIEGFISPLARNAFAFYRYRFEGTFLEGTYVVNKIRVVPKRESQQLCEGYLYIVEDLWCLHSSDLSINTIAGTIYLQQLYANVIMDAWLPVNHKIRADIKIAGVVGSITYVSSLKYSDVSLNPNLPEVYFSATDPGMNNQEDGGNSGDTPPVTREQERINELLQKEELSNRDVDRLSKLIEKEAEKAVPEKKPGDLNQTGTRFTIAENAVRNDSLYWSKVRPIPLTPQESITLKARDSIMGPGVPKAVRDSVRVARRRGNPARNLLLGKTYRPGHGRFRFEHDGLIDIDMLGYNTVDGISYGQQLRLDWRPDSVHTLRSHLRAGYAFQRKAPLLQWSTDLLYAPMARGKAALYLNYRSSDFNGLSGIPATTNMAYTLLLRQNHMKMYEQIEATLYNRIDVANGLVLTTSVTYGLQNRLENHSEFSLFFRNREFTPNIPAAIPGDAGELDDHRKFLGEVRLEYTPRQYFEIQNFRKNLKGSGWPTFQVGFRHAVPLSGEGWADFGELEAEISQVVETGLLSELDWSLSGG
ncbi:MAG: carboxypeptidase-like regulatory domain-containing protein, partial [Bacteroidetes bacterium]